MKRARAKGTGELRRRAEERLRPRIDGARGAGPEAQRLVHELRVHQVELEMQNEELRSSRLEVEEGLERYRQLFELAPIGYFVVSPGGIIRTVNFAGERLLRSDRTHLVGRSFVNLVAPQDAACFRQFLAAPEAAPGQSREVALRLDEGEGPIVRVSASGAALGEPALLLAAEDVTARRRAEEALRDESRRKDEFLATLSHELRNPLGPIRNGIFLLQHLPAGSDKATKAVAVMERQVGHLTRIVEDLLDVTRIARGKVRLTRIALDLRDLVRRTVEDHAPGFQARGIALVSRLGEDACWIDGDPTRLVQVIGNLLGNAEKFTGPGGRVEVALGREGGQVALSVRDTGVGIEPEVSLHLFEPFSQGRQALDRARGGLGLGLATVKGLVELHGGSVCSSSEGAGCGAEFTVRLPLAAPPRAPGATQGPHGSCHHRVLVIEDNEDAAVSLKQVLELSGHEVEVAADGPSGLALAHEHRPEVVICDIGLPGMDGYQVARAIRADVAAGKPYLIALTGYARPEDVRRASEAGFDRHVGKPPPVEQLATLLAEIPPSPAVIP